MNPNVQIHLHVVWSVYPQDGGALTDAVWQRLPTYATRYASTLGVLVRAVGGTGDHLHLVFDLPVDKAVEDVMGELQSATARFILETLGQSTFCWGDEESVETLSPADVHCLVEYVQGNAAHHAAGTTRPEWEREFDQSRVEADEATPEWLRVAMATDEG